MEHDFYFSIQLGMIIPTDKLIFFRGGETTNQEYSQDTAWFTVIGLLVAFQRGRPLQIYTTLSCSTNHGKRMESRTMNDDDIYEYLWYLHLPCVNSEIIDFFSWYSYIPWHWHWNLNRYLHCDGRIWSRPWRPTRSAEALLPGVHGVHKEALLVGWWLEHVLIVVPWLIVVDDG